MGLKNHPKMQLAILIIGILAIGLFLIVHFTPLSETKVDTNTTVPLPLGSKEFYRVVESITGGRFESISPSEIKLLSNGEQFFPDLLKEITSAKKSITITNYILKEGQVTNTLLDALIARAKDGVKIRLLLDGKGGSGKPEDKIKSLEDAGGKVSIFRPINLLKLTRANKRTHVRAMVIDGKIGYIGGVAFDDGWLSDGTEGKGYWRDLMFKIGGPGVEHVQDMFNQLWRQTDGEILSGEDFYPNQDSSTVKSLNPCDSTCFISFLHAPTPDLEKNLSQLLWASISGATDHIYLETPYLLPDANVLKALKEKALAGVNVQIIVPGPYIDSKIVKAASQSYYKEVLDSGIKIYEYQPAGLHSKIVTVDGKWSIIGSPNLDNRSSTLNIENVMGVSDEGLALKLEKEFALDKSRAKEITIENFKPNLLTAFLGRASRLFSKQY